MATGTRILNTGKEFWGLGDRTPNNLQMMVARYSGALSTESEGFAKRLQLRAEAINLARRCPQALDDAS